MEGSGSPVTLDDVAAEIARCEALLARDMERVDAEPPEPAWGGATGFVSPGGGAAGCTDEAGWRNGDRPGGALTCSDYAARYCAGGAFRPGSEWASGEGFRYPERACCACGGGGGGGRR